jgi:YesN/AraC family two-component response regulator
MDDPQQRRLNEAAEQLTQALVDSFRAVSQRGEAAQEQGAQLTQEFFNRVIDHLRAQAGGTREITQQLADQQQRAQKAAQTLTQDSVSAYMDFVNSMFSATQVGGQAAEKGTREAQKAATETPPERQSGAEQLPLENYDSLTVEQVSERLDDLSTEEIRRLRAYEVENKNRSTLLQRLDERIEA